MFYSFTPRSGACACTFSAASKEHLEDIKWLLTEVGNPLPDLNNPAVVDFLVDHTVWAVTDGEIAGGVFAFELAGPALPSPTFGPWIKVNGGTSHYYVDSLAVKKAHRYKNIASNLLKQVCAYARRKGCTAVGLEPYKNVAPACALYRKNGFFALAEEERELGAVIYFAKQLPPVTLATVNGETTADWKKRYRIRVQSIAN